MMWEEHPKYQQQQARLTAWGVTGLVVFGSVTALLAGDWDSLGEILLNVGAFVVAFGLLFGLAWVLVKLFAGKGDRRKI